MERNLKEQTLLIDIKKLIEESRQNVAVYVNAELTLLYWKIGANINKHILKKSRAEYGKQIIISLARQLTEEYGKGWSEKQLRHCLRFAEIISDEKIVSTLRRELSWTHIKTIIYLEDELKRTFYIEMCKLS